MPTARFTADPTEGEAPLTVNFDAAASSDPDGSIQSYAWDFGDGGTGSGVTTSHTYQTAGTYEATLTVTDDEGATASVAQTITVRSEDGDTGVVTMRLFDPQEEQHLWIVENTMPVDSGFVFGTNYFGDQAKAIALALPAGLTEAEVVEVKVWFAYKRDGLTSQRYHLEILNGDPASGPVGEPLYSESFPLAEVNADDDPGTASDATIHTLAQPVRVGSSFFICVSFGPYGAADWPNTAIAATERQGHRVPEVWEMWFDGTWQNLSDAWFEDGDDGMLLWIEASATVNAVPVVTNALDDIELIIGGVNFTQDLRLVFSDPDGDPLTFTASSGNEAVVTAAVSGAMLTVEAVSKGSTTVMLTADDGRGGSVSTSFTVNVPTGVAVEPVDQDLPETFALWQNYPNPFNPMTTLAYDVPAASAVRLVVYDVLGRQVRVLVADTVPAGRHEAVFEAGDLPSGVYVAHLVTLQGTFTQTMLLLK